MTSSLKPARLTPPGRILRRELDARGWTQKDLARIMGRPEQMISEVINGGKRITPETAHELAAAFDTSPELWLNLETKYRLQLAEKDAQLETIARKSRIYKLLPVPELVKRSWIKMHESVDELEAEIRKFLNIVSIDEAPTLVGNFRQSVCRAPHIPSQLAWVKRAENIARQQKVKPFDHANIEEALPYLLQLSLYPRAVAHIPGLLSEMGIHFVYVPHLPKTYLDGALFYCDNNPVIALSLRYDRIDSFWFTLMHEMGHLVEQHEGIIIDDLDENTEDERELKANQLARDWLIPPNDFDSFTRNKRLYSKSAIEQFAASIGRHPGIVLGRLHYENLVPYKNLRGLLVKASPYLGF